MDATQAGPGRAPGEVFLGFFAGLPDPRRHNAVHRFTDILTIAVLGVMCKADDWSEVRAWAVANAGWLGTFLALPRGIPSAGTFRRVFARVDPDAFERCFVGWAKALAAASAGRLVAVDGKALRRSFARAWDARGAHLVSAWCGANRVVLGQLAVDAKTNEITAIPALLDLLDVTGAVVTIDAMGCQRDIAGTVVGKGADYVLGLKDNQPTLYAKAKALLDEAVLDGFRGMSHGHFAETNGGHGRVETRRVWVTDEVRWLGADLLAQWPGLASVAVVEGVRRDLGDLTGAATTERRYFISSLPGCDDACAERVGRAVRGHWGVENRLHWRLDMAFREDESRIRKGHGAQNFSRLRRITLNQLKLAPGNDSLKIKRYLCSIDRQYLLDALSRRPEQ